MRHRTVRWIKVHDQFTMAMTFKPHPERSTLQIQGALSIYDALSAKAQLLSALHDSAALDVDLSQLTDLDTAGLQLLLLLKREAQRQNCDLRFLGFSREVIKMLDMYYLHHAFTHSSPVKNEMHR